jgi:gamma-glutamyltranspeptidase/glutathione hydrolase
MDRALSSPSRRTAIIARNVVATAQPVAAQAGLAILQRGGNAVDAALATAITLVVVEPVSAGLGADAFAIVQDGSKLHGLNASGRSPLAMDLEAFSGLDQMPDMGWDSVTVPGVVSAWIAMSKKFGRLPFAELFQPALRYARDGYHLTPTMARVWSALRPSYSKYPDVLNTYYPRGCAPEVGAIFTCPDLADTLEDIAETQGKPFTRYHSRKDHSARPTSWGRSLNRRSK